MPPFADSAETLVDVSLRGFAAVHSDIVRLVESPRFIIRRDAPVADKVGLVSGGGSGHEPLHMGFVGPGMLDAACPGEVFTSPTPDQMLAAAREVEAGAGVLFLAKNYSGDLMNFEMAMEAADFNAELLVIADEAAPGVPYPSGRRGLAGTVVVEKIVGAAAEAGADLAQCKALGERVLQGTRTLAAAFGGCTLPGTGEPGFAVDRTMMEYRVGIHGERGRESLKRTSAAALAERMVGEICDDLGCVSGERFLLLVNGLGGLPLIRTYQAYAEIRRACRDRGLDIVRSLVGDYVACLDMAGCSATLSRMDDELLPYWDAPVHTAALRRGA